MSLLDNSIEFGCQSQRLSSSNPLTLHANLHAIEKMWMTGLIRTCILRWLASSIVLQENIVKLFGQLQILA